MPQAGSRSLDAGFEAVQGIHFSVTNATSIWLRGCTPTLHIAIGQKHVGETPGIVGECGDTSCLPTLPDQKSAQPLQISVGDLSRTGLPLPKDPFAYPMMRQGHGCLQ